MLDPTGIKIDFDPTRQRMTGVTHHGHIPFDVPFISKVGYNLWQGGCRDGLMLPHFIKYIVSLYPWEKYKIQHHMDGELYLRMYDDKTRDVLPEVDDLARLINVWRERGPVLVHCQAGLNRSALVTGRALMLSGKTAAQAIELMREKRSPAVLCNPSFEKYLYDAENEAWRFN